MPPSTAAIGHGCGNCMGVQTRHNPSRNGGCRSPATSEGLNSGESEDGGKAAELEMQGGGEKVEKCRRSRNWTDATL